MILFARMIELGDSKMETKIVFGSDNELDEYF